MTHGELGRNQILAALPEADVNALLEHAAPPVTPPTGHTLQFPGEPYSTVFFPTSGVVSGASMLPGGQNIEVAAGGVDGVVAVRIVLGLPNVNLWFVVQIGASGYRVPVETFRRMFFESERLRQLTLAHTGRLLVEIARSAACNWFHSHRERLARWLAVTSRKAGTASLDLTHDFIAQIVGGPRHAVTAGLRCLRARGAVNYERGHVVVVDEHKLLEAACECVGSAHPVLPSFPHNSVLI